jgi:hypothetical protein
LSISLVNSLGSIGKGSLPCGSEPRPPWVAVEEPPSLPPHAVPTATARAVAMTVIVVRTSNLLDASVESRDEEPMSAAHNGAVNLAAEILIVFLLVVPIFVIGALFVWAAIKDGQEDRALQKRLGIRRRTRLGR